jgi:hypothetical protein
MKLFARAACAASLGILSMVWSSAAAAQQPPGKSPVSLVVSVEAKRGKDVPAVQREDVRVLAGKMRLEVTEWKPYQDNGTSNLQLLVLIDEVSDPELSSRFDELRQFLDAQPANTELAVGYMENGGTRTVQNFTADHAAATKALRVPIGLPAGENSPYLSLTEALKHWPSSDKRRTVLMISSGADPMQPGPSDTYLQNAIAVAQRTGTQVYTLYTSSSGHFGHSLWRVNQAQSNLSQLADQTGGEAYFQGTATPISLRPFLDQFSERLRHQYKLSFLAPAKDKPGYLDIKLETEVSNADLVSADRVFVPATK